MCHKSIIIADDDESVLEVCSLILSEKEKEGFNIETFSGGKYLLNYFIKENKKGNKIPLAILDIEMPEMDGLTTAKKLRFIDPNIIIIIITGKPHISLKTIRDNLKKDIYYIRKPFNREEFSCLVDSLIKGWTSKMELKKYHHQLEELVQERTDQVIKTYKRLKKSEEKFRLTFENAVDAIFWADTKTGIIINCNKAAERLLEKDRKEIIGKHQRTLHAPEKRDYYEEVFKKQEQIYFSGADAEVITGNGTIKFVTIRASIIEVEDEIIVQGIFHDITEKKSIERELKKYRNHLEELVEKRTLELKNINLKLEQEICERKEIEKSLIESEKKFKELYQEYYTLLEAIPDMVVVMSPEMKILWANKKTIDKFGKEKIFNDNCYKVLCEKDNICKNCPVRKCFAEGKQAREELMLKGNRYFDVIASPIKDENGKTIKVLEVTRDISEKVFLQKDAFRTSHLASVGELAAGIAHEINNPITGIINYAQLLVNKADKDTREYNIYSRIIKEGERIASIIRRLLFFANPESQRKETFFIKNLIYDAMALTAAQLAKEEINFSLKIEENLPPLKARGNQLQHVFLNIISNSRHALNKKYGQEREVKTIEISAEKAIVDEKDYIKIIFHDNGCGIKKDIQNKVMNPFFSTEPMGKATGLGLSISYGIIIDHNGRLNIESIEGEFTKIIVDLPVWRKQ